MFRERTGCGKRSVSTQRVGVCIFCHVSLCANANTCYWRGLHDCWPSYLHLVATRYFCCNPCHYCMRLDPAIRGGDFLDWSKGEKTEGHNRPSKYNAGRLVRGVIQCTQLHRMFCLVAVIIHMPSFVSSLSTPVGFCLIRENFGVDDIIQKRKKISCSCLAESTNETTLGNYKDVFGVEPKIHCWAGIGGCERIYPLQESHSLYDLT